MKTPRIIVTNIDEEPGIRKARERRKRTEIIAVVSIVAINWIIAVSKSCFVFGITVAIITTIICVMQYVIMIKTKLSVHFGESKNKFCARYHESITPVSLCRWSIARILRCKKSWPRKVSRIAQTPDSLMSISNGDSHMILPS